jgi:hypothetical protein
MNQATRKIETAGNGSTPRTYPFKGDVVRLLTHAQAFLTSLEQMQSVPLGLHHARTLEQVREGMEQLAVAANGIVDYLAYSTTPEVSARFEAWPSDLREDLARLLGVVQRVEENVEHFSLLLSHDSA